MTASAAMSVVFQLAHARFNGTSVATKVIKLACRLIDVCLPGRPESRGRIRTLERTLRPMHNPQAGLLAWDDRRPPSHRFSAKARKEPVAKAGSGLMVNGKFVPYSGASASDSHRLPIVTSVEEMNPSNQQRASQPPGGIRGTIPRTGDKSIPRCNRMPPHICHRIPPHASTITIHNPTS